MLAPRKIPKNAIPATSPLVYTCSSLLCLLVDTLLGADKVNADALHPHAEVSAMVLLKAEQGLNTVSASSEDNGRRPAS